MKLILSALFLGLVISAAGNMLNDPIPEAIGYALLAIAAWGLIVVDHPRGPQ